MSIFNRDKLAAPPLEGADGRLDLPKGYDDETSPYFVPEHLRATWKDSAGLADTVTHHAATVRAIAQYRLLQSQQPEEFQDGEPTLQWQQDAITREPVQAVVKRRARAPHLLAQAAEAGRSGGDIVGLAPQLQRLQADSLAREQWESIAPEAIHALRLHFVIAEAERRAEAARIANTIARRNLCPLCKTSDHGTGAAASRDVVPAGKNQYSKAITLLSCGRCYLAAIEYLTEQYSSESLPEHDGQTRRDLISTHMQQRGI